jgi:hypothetical protein
LEHWELSSATGLWNKICPVPDTTPESVACIISTDFTDGDHRGLEALVFTPKPPPLAPPIPPVLGTIKHYKYNPDSVAWDELPVLWPTELFAGPACFIQSDYPKAPETHHQNFEAVFLLRRDSPWDQRTFLEHWYRDNGLDTGWHSTATVADQAIYPASMIQTFQIPPLPFPGQFRHGDLEVAVVEADNEFWHHWRASETLAWSIGGPIT